MVSRFEDRDFLKTANQILDNNYLPLDLSVKDQGQTMLFMLYSRNKRNIAKEDLDFIENSGSLETFQGFFREETTK